MSELEALKASGDDWAREKKARALLTDARILYDDVHGTPEALQQDIVELLGAGDFEDARYRVGRRGPITECTCPQCRVSD